ncbi:SAV_2336 N-terminal domain-related protein [Streptomyces sp. NPDC014870]|uniref:SAV_2336 N-terminal domain-related protein n=1 Tax=Streptomyces sp. NPDC014870 TaxID=3364925 RepID=UPI0036FAD1F7
MTIQRLCGLLEDAGVDLSMEELLDVLWLAATTREEAPATESGAAARPHTPAVAEPDPAGDARGADHATTEPERGPADRTTDKAPQALYAPGGGRGRRLPARSVGLRGVRAIPAARGLQRALRPLRRPTKSRTSFVVDESATADLIADTALPDAVLPDVVMRPEQERWLDAVLVVDDGPSMVLWRQYATEARALLENQGIFHRVRTYGLDSADPDRPVLRSRPFAPTSARVPARRLADPVRPTVVLVLSDGVGPGWSGGALPALLGRWAGHSPVAVVQPLPERLWPAPVMPAEQWLVTADRPAAPGRTLDARHPVLPPGLVTHEGPAIPVFELEETRLSAWTRLLLGGGAGGGGRAGELLHLLAPPGPADSHAAATAPGTSGVRASSAEDHLRAFRQSASPESRKLAGALASVRPLTLPVMRLVHQAEQPGPGTFHPAQLAEVFLGGLLRRREGGPAGRGEERADCAEYEFLPGVADLLLDTVRTSHAVDTATRVSDFLMRRRGNGPEFRARLSGGGGSVIAPGGGAFAAASPELLRRLGLAAERPPVEEREPEPEDSEEEPVEDDVSLAHVWPRIAAFARRLMADEGAPEIVPEVAGLLEPWLDRPDPGSVPVAVFEAFARALVESGQRDAVDEFRGLLRDCAEPFLRDDSLAARNVRGHTAIALSALGETAEAAERMNAVIAVSARVHGEHHGYTLTARAFLHEMYEDADWLAEGAAEGRELIETLQRLPRTDEMPDFGDVQMVQGRILHRLGKLVEGEQAFRAACEDYTSELGVDHDSTLYARGWVATALLRLGRMREAEEEARAVLAVCERLDGDEGAPARPGGQMTALGVLEEVVRQAGNYKELLAVRNTMMELRELGEGALSRTAIAARRVWAAALRWVKDYDGALKAAEDAAERAGRLLGESHIESLLTREMVALVLADRKQFEEAERRQRAILDQGRRVLGEDHANTLDFRHNLGSTLLRAERFEEAEAVLRSAAEDHVRVIGYRHANTRSVQRLHAEALVRLERLGEAEAVLRRLLESELGLPRPPLLSIMETRVDLGQILSGSERHDEASEQFTLVWRARSTALGGDAPKTLNAAVLLASSLINLERFEEARNILSGVLRSRERTLGSEGRETLWARMWLGDALEGLGRNADAAAHWGAVREVAVRLWGETDRMAVAARRSLDRVGLGPGPGAEVESAAQE